MRKNHKYNLTAAASPGLIRPYTGHKKTVAKEDLDALIDAEKARLKAQKEA